MSDESSHLKVIRRPDPQIRRFAVDFIKGLYCINCPFKSECSSKYPQYLIKCRYLEEWVLKIYTENVEKKDKK